MIDDPGRALREMEGSHTGMNLGGIEILHLSILGSLTDTLTDEEAQMLLNALMGAGGPNSPVAALRGPQLIGPAVLQRMWRHPRARTAAWQVVFREVTFPVLIEQMPVVVATELIRQDAFDRPTTSDEDDLLWEIAESVFKTYREGKLGGHQFISLGIAWRGFSYGLGWALMAPTLDPVLRAQIAYILGCRYQTLGKHEQAVRFFETARQGAAPDSLMHRLAAEQMRTRE